MHVRRGAKPDQHFQITSKMKQNYSGIVGIFQGEGDAPATKAIMPPLGSGGQEPPPPRMVTNFKIIKQFKVLKMNPFFKLLSIFLSPKHPFFEEKFRKIEHFFEKLFLKFQIFNFYGAIL